MIYFTGEIGNAPAGYYDALDAAMRKHRYVGRRAFIDGKIYKCVRAEDDRVIFQATEASEIIITGYDAVSKIKWCKASCGV